MSCLLCCLLSGLTLRALWPSWLDFRTVHARAGFPLEARPQLPVCPATKLYTHASTAQSAPDSRTLGDQSSLSLSPFASAEITSIFGTTDSTNFPQHTGHTGPSPNAGVPIGWCGLYSHRYPHFGRSYGLGSIYITDHRLLIARGTTRYRRPQVLAP